MTTTLLVILFQRMFGQRSVMAKLIFEIFSVFLTLVIIYYASEAFNFKSDPEVKTSLTLFTFLLVGEVSLIMPLSSAERWLSNLSNLRNQQFYQTLLGLRISPFRFILSQVLIDLIFPLFRIMFILLGGYFLNRMQLTMTNVSLFLIIQFYSIIIFLLMAQVASFIYLKYGRGFGFFYTFQTVSTIIGGAYFPISIFPAGLKNFSSYLPQTQILEVSRSIFSARPILGEAYLVLLSWGVFLSVLVVLTNKLIVKDLKRTARYF